MIAPWGLKGTACASPPEASAQRRRKPRRDTNRMLTSGAGAGMVFLLWVSPEVSRPAVAKTEAAKPRHPWEIRQSMKEGKGPVKPCSSLRSSGVWSILLPHDRAGEMARRRALRHHDDLRSRRRDSLDSPGSRARGAAAAHVDGRLRPQDRHAAHPGSAGPLRHQDLLLRPRLDRRALSGALRGNRAPGPRGGPPGLAAREGLLQ